MIDQEIKYEFFDLQLTGNSDIDIPAMNKLTKEGWTFIGIASNFMVFKRDIKEAL